MLKRSISGVVSVMYAGYCKYLLLFLTLVSECFFSSDTLSLQFLVNEGRTVLLWLVSEAG